MSFVSGTSNTGVALVVPIPPANNGAGKWMYNATAEAHGPISNLTVSRNVPTPIEFMNVNQQVYLWKTGESVSGQVVGMSGSSWAVYADSTAAPGTPDRGNKVAAFNAEVTNPNAGTGNRAKGWFSAQLPAGT